MNRFIHIIAFCIFSLSAVPMLGQDKEQDFERIRIESFRQEITRDSLTLRELLREVDSLEIIMSNKSVLDSLRKRKNELLKSNKALRDDIEKKNSLLSDTRNKMERNAVYLDRQLAENYTRDKTYLGRKYSEMSSATLQLLRNKAERYKEMPDFEDYKSLIDRMIDNKKLYDKLFGAINGPLTCLEKVNLREELDPLLEDGENGAVYMLSPVQYHELDTLDIKLSRYHYGTKKLQEIVVKINDNPTIKQIRKSMDYSRKRDCLNIIREIIEPTVGTEEYNIHQKYFEMVPYLKTLLEEYWNELQDDPISVPTRTQLSILKLEVE